jgi:biopolymer transport protein TolR
MAMGVGSGGGTRRGKRVRRRAALSEINVTPLVDVMLVLLIIFMISAPLLTSGIKVQLPKTEAAALKDEGDPITITVDKDGGYYIADNGVAYDQIAPRLEAMTSGDHTKPIYVRAAATVAYEHVAKLMARLSQSGFVKINLLTETSGKVASASSQSAEP